MAYPFKKTNPMEEGGDYAPTPEGYTHKALSKSIDALDTSLSNNQTITDAITHMTLRVDMLERICRARNILDEKNEKEYTDAIKEYKPTETNETIKKGMLANYKLQLLMAKLFTISIKDKEIIF